MNKMKRILAVLGVVLLISLYIVSLISALTAKPYAHSLFVASIFSTIAVPIFIYGLLAVYRAVHKHSDDEITIRELKKKNRNL